MYSSNFNQQNKHFWIASLLKNAISNLDKLLGSAGCPGIN
jgi:hypothetical protein